MWVYMISCYVLSLLTFLLLITSFFQSFLKFSVFYAGHVTFMILTSIVYLFTETMVIFFFVGSGMGIKERTMEHKLDPRHHQQSKAIKKKVFPPLMMNMVFMMILFILVGAVDTHRLPVWAYDLIFAGCIIHYVKVKVTQNGCFRDNTNIILEMSGL